MAGEHPLHAAVGRVIDKEKPAAERVDPGRKTDAQPVRARRLEFEKEPAKVLRILNAGSDRARDVAQKTMSRVREAVFGWDSKRKEIFGTREQGEQGEQK